MSLRGVLLGALTLVVLEVFVTSTGAQTATATGLDSIGNLVRAFLSPNVPAIPDLRNPDERKAESAAPATPGAQGQPGAGGSSGGGAGGGGGGSWGARLAIPTSPVGQLV